MYRCADSCCEQAWLWKARLISRMLRGWPPSFRSPIMYIRKTDLFSWLKGSKHVKTFLNWFRVGLRF